MEDTFRIFIDQLKGGKEEQISLSEPPTFLGVEEKELEFTGPVQIEGKAYLANDELVLHLNITSTCKMPCNVCNEIVEVKVRAKDVYSCHPLEEIKGGIFDFREVVREELLLEVPHFIECGTGRCQHREELKPYLKKGGEKVEDEGYHPFADLS